PGGMMRYGIPAYRLPGEILDREIERVLSVGVTLQTGKALGRDFDLDSLMAEGFDAVFIGTGLQLSRKIDLDGADLPDVFWGVDFLGDVGRGKEIRLKDRVLVVGGGNVAVDVALTALRLGAGEVTMACLEGREEMPASPWEIEQALEEGVRLLPSWGPHRIVGRDGKVSEVELVRCTSVFDEGGNFCPAFGEEKRSVEADQVILAIGQAADLTFIGEESRIRTERGLIPADPETQETGMPGVFAGGDVGRGPAAIIDAIAAGRRAAAAMDRFLGGDGNIEERLVERADTSGYDGKRERGFADRTREPMPTLPLEERHAGFGEVDLCLDDEQALREAGRCLQCDLELKLGRG
ncbi:MAG: FAD-dependent oxidoreductase, partial [Deltaproteobacteria bacterium]|nr:FAD-dependent oxidoreductase [Deltaproteobacteria bacterium]